MICILGCSGPKPDTRSNLGCCHLFQVRVLFGSGATVLNQFDMTWTGLRPAVLAGLTIHFFGLSE